MTDGPAPRLLTLPTPAGPARVHLHRPTVGPAATKGVLLLGHGAGPSISTVDLLAATAAGVASGWVVALVEQPWLVAGKRIATRPPVLDSGWLAVAAGLREAGGALAEAPGPWVAAGRSAGARVACRTAVAVGAQAVLCLSFPLHPPGRPTSTRAEEVLAVLTAGLPVSVVQGERDPFGSPGEVVAAVPALAGRVYAVPGTHTIARTATAAVGEAVRTVLGGIPG